MKNFGKIFGISVVCGCTSCYNAPMKLNYDRKSKDPTYFVQLGIRNGKKTTTKNIARIGKHSELLKITDDPLAYAKEQVKKYNEEAKKNKPVPLEVKLNFEEKIKSYGDLVSSSKQLNVGYLFLQQVYHDLEIGSFFQHIAENSEMTFDPNQVYRFLVYSRILEQDFKPGTYRHKADFYEQPEFNDEQVIQTMDLLEEHCDEYMAYLLEKSTKYIKKDRGSCFYDPVNHYFQIGTEDEEYVDAVTGERLPKLAPYEAGRREDGCPAGLGIIMDSYGIPVSMFITSGTPDGQETAEVIEKDFRHILKGKNIVRCVDGSKKSLRRKTETSNCRGFIISQAVNQLPDALKKAVFSDRDYRKVSTDEPVSVGAMRSFDRMDGKNRGLYQDKAYKVLRRVPDFDTRPWIQGLLERSGADITLSETVSQPKIIITFSRKLMEFQRSIRERQIQRARKRIQWPAADTYKYNSDDAGRFIKRVSSQDSREVYELDQDLIAEEEKYDGFSAIVTDLDGEFGSIVETSFYRYKLQDCFRALKTDLPAAIHPCERKRVIAHSIICYTALLLCRILETKMRRYETEFTIDNLIDTMNNMEVSNIEDMCYMSTYGCSRVSNALNGILDIGLDKKYYLPKELNRKVKKISG